MSSGSSNASPPVPSAAPKKTRTAILISGRGSNMLALIEAAKAPDYPAEICLVISNRPKAAGLALAQSNEVAAIGIDHKAFESRDAFEAAMTAELEKHEIEFIACAGFMRVLGERFVRHWAGKMINIHPSLLPKYKGLHTHRRALDAKDREHGCTVHWVNEGVDDGAIIAQSSLILHKSDVEESLAKRVQILEHALYPKALRKALTRH